MGCCPNHAACTSVWWRKSINNYFACKIKPFPEKTVGFVIWSHSHLQSKNQFIFHSFLISFLLITKNDFTFWIEWYWQAMHVAHQYQACLLIRLASVEMVTACFCDVMELVLPYFKEIWPLQGAFYGKRLSKDNFKEIKMFLSSMFLMPMWYVLRLWQLKRKNCPEIEGPRKYTLMCWPIHFTFARGRGFFHFIHVQFFKHGGLLIYKDLFSRGCFSYGLCPWLDHDGLHWEEKSCFLATILAVLIPFCCCCLLYSK